MAISILVMAGNSILVLSKSVMNFGSMTVMKKMTSAPPTTQTTAG